MAYGPNLARQKIIRLATSAIATMLSCVTNGARDKSEILVLDIVYKNILNENKHATVSMFGSIYLACKILINESHQHIG